MAPAFLCNDIAPKSIYAFGETLHDSKRNSIQSNDSLFSFDSYSSSPNDNSNGLLITGRSSKTEFLNKIKYFERRTDHELPEVQKIHPNTNNQPNKPSFKETLEEVRSHFPKNENAYPIKTDKRILKNNEKDSLREVRKPKPTPRKRFKVEEQENIKHVNQTKGKEDSNEPKVRKPVIRELSIREIVNDVRSQFSEKNHEIKQNKNESTVNLTLEHSTYNCTNFFSTSDIRFLPDDVSKNSKHFIIILKGILYDNAFYSLKDISNRAHYYYLQDTFDYDSLDMDLFDPWAI